MNPSICTIAGSASKLRYEASELVRGQEQRLLAALLPVVREGDLTLDLGKVNRIDAAGISALLELYVGAMKAGRRFAVTNPSRRVAEMLKLVGLAPVLVRRNVEPDGMRPNALNHARNVA